MTNTYLTGNPLGSKAVKDLSDNASNFDEAVNSDSPSFIDRFSKRRETLSGLKQMVVDFLAASGFQFLGDYDADGPLTITLPNQVFSKDGEYWRAGPSLVLPYTTVDNWVIDAPKFVSTGDATLRQALASAAGATMIGTANGQTVQEALNGGNSDDVLIQGGSTDKSTDDTAAVIAALATGKRIIGDPNKWYGINTITWPSALRIRGVRFYALNPDPVSRRVIFQSGGTVCELENVTIDRNGSGVGGQIGNSAAIYISYCQSLRIQNCEVTGNNYGDGIIVTDSNVFIDKNYIHDMTWGTPGGSAQTDDRMQGIFAVRCTGQISNNVVSKLYGQWSGQAPINKWTRGYALGGCYDLRVIGNSCNLVDQSYDYTGGENNRRIITIGCVATNSGSWGFKAANTVTDCIYVGCITYRSGLAGFVASAPPFDISTPGELLTQNITYTACKSISNGWGSAWAGNGSRGGFLASNSPTYPEYPRGIKYIGCQSYGPGNSQFGFRNDVVVPSNTSIWNEAINCDSQDSVTDYIGMNQGSLIRAGATDQAVSSATLTSVLLNNTISDRMNAGPANVVRRSGLYLVNGYVNFSGNANGTRHLRILVNDAQVQGGSFIAGANASGTGVGGSFVYRFTAGQTVRMEVSQDSGSTLTLSSAFMSVTELLQGQS